MESSDRGTTVTRRGGRGVGSGLKLLRIPKRNDEVLEGEDDQEPLSPTARLFHEPRNNCHVLAIIGSAKKLDFEAVKAELEKTLIRHPRFSSVPVFSEGELGRWVPTKVVVEDHCVFPDVDPDDRILRDPDRFVEDYVAALTRAPMDTSRALWEFHALNVKTREAQGVALLRAHHSLGDGTSLISLLLALTRKTSDPDSLPAAPPPPLRLSRRRRFDNNNNNNNRSVAGFAASLVAAAWMLLRTAFYTVVDILLFVATFLFLKDSETALKGAEGVEFRPKRIVHRTLQLDDFKLIKTELGTTINDVMMGVTSAGLSRYLSRTTYSGGDLPRNLLVRSAILVNLRPTPGFHVMAKMMEKRGTGTSSHRDRWGNWIGYVLVPFPMALFEDPLDYVRKAKAIADRKKLSFESLFTFASSALLVNTFGIKAAAALSHRVIFNTTLSFSNLAGPAEELSFAGHPITFLAPSAYGHPHALTVHFQSYMDKVKMVLAVDEEAIPEPHQLLHDLADSLELIKDAVLAKRR